MNPEENGIVERVVPSRDSLNAHGIVEFDLNGRSKPVYISNKNRDWSYLFEEMIVFYAKALKKHDEIELLKPEGRIPFLNDLSFEVKRRDFGVASSKELASRNMIISPRHKIIAYDKLPEDFSKSFRFSRSEDFLRGRKGYDLRGDFVNLGRYVEAYGLDSLRGCTSRIDRIVSGVLSLLF